MIKITSAQKTALSKFETGEDYSAYTLQASIATLYVLEEKGLVCRSHPDRVGTLFDNRVSIDWKLTKRGEEMKKMLSQEK